jgi:hypothetical protein
MFFKPPLQVHTPIYGQIYKILYDETSNKRQYEVKIKTFPICICMDLVTMISSSLGKCVSYIMYCNMSCFVNSLKFSSFPNLEL